MVEPTVMADGARNPAFATEELERQREIMQETLQHLEGTQN